MRIVMENCMKNILVIIAVVSATMFLFSGCNDPKSSPSVDDHNVSGDFEPQDLETQEFEPDEAGLPDEADSEFGDFEPDEAQDDFETDDEDEFSGLIEKVKSCSPTVSSCDAMVQTSDSTIYASFRKDFYYEHYQEGDLTNPIAAPKDGGRFHIAGTSSVTGSVTALKINGQLVDAIIADKKMVWATPYPFEVKEGEPVWVSFHSQEKSWDTSSTGTVTIETDNGIALDGTFPVNLIEIPITYVTTTDDLSRIVIHLHNRTSQTQKLTQLLYRGRDITDSACIADKSIAPNEHVMWTFDLCEKAQLGELWSVVAKFDHAKPSVAGGRVIREFYPIETWQSTSDCPFPGANDANYQKHRDAGIDTFFLHGGTGNTCGFDNIDMIENIAVEHNFWLMPERNIMKKDDGTPGITNTERVAAYFSGDEADSRIYNSDGSEFATIPWEKYKNHTEFSWRHYPEIPVYLGGSRHRYNGAFSGCTDIQGFDFYIAACAPHITVVEANMPPLRAAFDMLFAVKENHMPLPTWLYTQALATMWEITWPPLVGGEKFKRAPNAMEQRLSIASVLAAGAKGLMYFQTNMALANSNPATWDEIHNINKDVRALRKHLRVADFGSVLPTDENTIATLLRGEKILVLVVINLANTGPLTELQCQTEKDPHWVLVPSFPDINFDVPQDIGISHFFELRNGIATEPDYIHFNNDQRTVNLNGIPLSDEVPSRIFVFTEDEKTKNEIVSLLD
jgi:hypothetical protein